MLTTTTTIIAATFDVEEHQPKTFRCRDICRQSLRYREARVSVAMKILIPVSNMDYQPVKKHLEAKNS